MSTAPVLLPGGQVMLAGKSRIVYLLNGAHLGGIGHQQATLGAEPDAIMGSACSNDIDGGAAVLDMTVFLPCTAGIVAVQATSLRPGCTCFGVQEPAAGPHHRRGPRLDHRAERHAVRARSGHRPGAAAGSDRRASQSFLHAEHGRWPPAGRLRGQRCRLRRACPWRRDDPGRRPGAAHGRPGPFGTRGFGTRGAHPSPAARHRRDHPGRSRGDRRARLVPLAATERRPPDSQHQFSEPG